jgi:hypothetical protein
MQKQRSAEFAAIPIVVVTVGTPFLVAAPAGRQRRFSSSTA